MRDPRPLLGEPLAVDLVDTQWLVGEQVQDLLGTADGVDTWLVSAGFRHLTPAGPATAAALRHTRQVLLALLAQPRDAGARAALNEVLDRGRRVRRLTESGPHTGVEVRGAAGLVAWLAAENYLDLLERGADRIRRCDHPHCVLWFFDATRAGTRRWCSMAVCGNRSKAERHYRRTRVSDVSPASRRVPE